MYKRIMNNIKTSSPLVHNITNYVTANDCANILLACGGSPIMADDIQEVEDITSLCDALVINMGTLNVEVIEAMVKASIMASKLNHPIILDPVGAGASKFRTDITTRFIKELKFTVIRGNISEVKTVSHGKGTTKGVDADIADAITYDNMEESVEFAKQLSQRTGAIIAITGAIDIVANQEKAYIIQNGHEVMSKVTGTGCMLSSLIGAYCAANPNELLDAVATAVCSMGICGELAHEKMMQSDTGFSSFKTYLIDYMSKMDDKMLKEGAKIECR